VQILAGSSSKTQGDERGLVLLTSLTMDEFRQHLIDRFYFGPLPYTILKGDFST